ncbi:hypothetical protein QMK17_23845 [Rhodococcus sp. G-MC3]|uniref:hypothetical protein n=1 Tax=Rhodococcus sp. G-MC3 TaxID=3046209 RepID=UPI0024BBCA50|nr:hypothetical protein [Rhodococcus sp. G-MC3]MDJ0396342.1 hypothetical protein [Rhodococcus sp. G-MC3]
MTIRWICALLTALSTAAAIATATWLFTPVAPALPAAVFGICTVPAGLAIGWIVFVAPRTTPRQGPSDDDVESRWLNTAMSGTATDLICAIGLTLAAVSVTGAEPPTQLLLIGLLLCALASATARYTLQRRRTLSTQT